jgi:hypothetical protein
VGIFGWDKDETLNASNRTASQVEQVATDPGALARARAARPEGGLSGAATKLIGRLLEVGIDGRGPFDSAEKVAAKALREAGGNPDAAIKIVQRNHRQLAAVGGFVTGLGGFFTMPVSLPVNLLEFFVLGTRMTAATAKLRGYDLTQPEIRSAILLSLVGADSEDVLKRAGLQLSGGRIVSLATDRLPATALMVLNKAIGFRLLGRLGQGTFAKLGRGVPLVGGLIGGGVDLFMLGKIAEAGTKEFPAVMPVLAR